MQLLTEVLDGEETFVFMHDGSPFRPDDLSALMGGGSSKDPDSDDTTGRFGTGFLSTHVLSTRTRVEGLLALDGAHEWFAVDLERSGNLESILQNIRDCHEAMDRTKPVASLELAPQSAHFVYHGGDTGPMRQGLNACRRSLPFLFSTCPLLVEVRLEGSETWQATSGPGGPLRQTKGGWLRERTLRVEADGAPPRRLRTLRYSLDESGEQALIVALREDDRGGLSVLGPERETPKVFRKFPLSDLSVLPFGFVLDGAFEPTQERENVLLEGEHGETSRARVRRALQALPVALLDLLDRGVLGLEALAQLWHASADAGLGDASAFWQAEAKQAAHALAQLPIVPTSGGLRPGLSANDGVVFPASRRNARADSDLLPFEDLTGLVAQVQDLLPPSGPTAQAWTRAALSWRALGLQPRVFGLAELGAHVASRAKSLMELDALVGCESWLVSWFDLVGRLWAEEGTNSELLVDGLIPDQEGRLRKVGQLKQDEQVPSQLKDIAERIDLPLRRELVHDRLSDQALHEHPAAAKVVRQVTKEPLTVERTVERMVEQLATQLKTGVRVDEGAFDTLEAAGRLLVWLWGEGHDVERLKRLPLLSAGGVVIRGDEGKSLMLPPSCWAPEARDYADIYAEGRVLHERVSSVAGLPRALVESGLAFPDPLLPAVKGTRIPKEKLKSMVREEVETETLSVERLSFSAIAALDDAVLNSVGEDEERAKRVWEFVLRYVAPKDRQSHEYQELSRRGDEPSLSVRRGRWPSDLLGRAWIPLKGTDEENVSATIKVHPTPEVLTDLIKAEWLTDNPAAIELLTGFFNVDALDLRLLAFDSSPEKAKLVRGSLAKILDASNADPNILQRIAAEAERLGENQVTLDKWRDFGLTVQKCVEQALIEAKLDVKVEDYGKDFIVTLGATGGDPDVRPDLDELSHELRVGEWYVEVKATTGSEVCLTPTQASTASDHPERWVLCVVPLSRADLDLSADELGAQVRKHARFVSGIGAETTDTVELVRKARAQTIGIKGEKGLRYVVPSSQWATGQLLNVWVNSILGEAKDQS
ncbi:MAG: hypothetical protein H6741_21655 [Alphaproteobacteria bacterium]|nr:hypothetical protein [Alphaproteobacteria bacterium]MCB9795318.1 hypothetical protein [Alphaproteobacteria bacterium]